MEPLEHRFGGGASDTVLHPLVAVAMLLAIIFILLLPRKYAVVPFLVGMFTIPIGQVVVLAGLHFTVLRILILTGLIRWATAPFAQKFAGRFNRLDCVTILWTLSSFAVFSLQWMTKPALVVSLGDLLDRLGGFLVLRFMIQNTRDLKRAIKVFAVICLILGMFMLNEQITGRNLFGLLGGISLWPQIRNGHPRSQGALANYIDAGVFGGLLMPLFIWLWSSGRSSRRFAAIGIVGGASMCVTCHSSTAVLALTSGLLGLCLWRLRERMRMIRRGLVVTLIALHLVMNGPVWSLIARIDLTGSSDSYHRYYLVNNCIIHFWNWWLLGMKAYDSWGWDMWDLSDQYVACALTGGLMTLGLFIGILSCSFGNVGTARKVARGKKDEWLLWCLGSTILAMVVCFFGCSFMAQMQIELFAFLAMISAATFGSGQRAKATVSTSSESAQLPQLEPAPVEMFR